MELTYMLLSSTISIVKCKCSSKEQVLKLKIVLKYSTGVKYFSVSPVMRTY